MKFLFIFWCFLTKDETFFLPLYSKKTKPKTYIKKLGSYVGTSKKGMKKGRIFYFEASKNCSFWRRKQKRFLIVGVRK